MLYELVMETTSNLVINKNTENKNNENKGQPFFCEPHKTSSNITDKTIVDETNSLCEHEIIEDYVETGVESNMVKIRYCHICEVTFTYIKTNKN